MLRYLTAGESHGRCLLAILEGMVAGLAIDKEKIDRQLARRQLGFGRGKRMDIEKDKVQILSGLKKGATIGSPIAMMIENKDFSIERLPAVTRPRPGHADLAGGIKYGSPDLREVLERASARETAARVAVGSVCRIFLEEFGIDLLSHVVMVGGIEADTKGLSFDKIRSESEKSVLRCAEPAAASSMAERIELARKVKDTLGGVFEIAARGLPVGLGSYVHSDRRLDARLAGALMSIPGIKGVESGMGFEAGRRFGSDVHDQIFYRRGRGFYRQTNNAGGLEGGVTNGEPLVFRCCMKPISTLGRPLGSVDIRTKKTAGATVERHDICAVPAAGVVGEAAVAFELAKAFLEKFGGDSLGQTKRNFQGYLKQVRRY